MEQKKGRTKIRTIVAGGMFIFLVCGCANQSEKRESADIAPGTIEQTSQRYINPLSIEESTNIADPTVLRFKGTYYLFLTGGMVWSSNDFVHWKGVKKWIPKRHRANNNVLSRVLQPCRGHCLW